MVVKTQCNGRAYTGVAVGDRDVRRYFPQKIESVDLELDHLLIRCGLGARFWNGESLIIDPRLAAWLESKNFHWRPGEEPVALAMVPSGKNSFRIRACRLRKASRESREFQIEV